MEELNEQLEQEPEITESDEDEELTVVEKIIGVYTSPVATFRYLSRRFDFLSPLIVLSLIIIALTVVTLPKKMPVIESGTIAQMQEQFDQAGTPESEREMAVAIAQKTVRIGSYVGAIIGTPITLAITWLLMSALIFFIALIQGLETDFKRVLGVIPWVSFIGVLSQVVVAIMDMTREITSMDQLQDLRFTKPVSLLGIMPEGANFPLWQEGFLAAIDPFTIWALIVTVFALESANRCKRSQAWVTAIIATVIGLAVAIGLMALGAKFGPQ